MMRALTFDCCWLIRDLYDRVSAIEFITGQQPRRPWRTKSKDRKPRSELSTDYNEYIKSPEWRKFRQSIFGVRGRVCQKCMATNTKLEIHHKNYRSFKNEKPEDVVVLCHKCHTHLHDSRRSKSNNHGEQK